MECTAESSCENGGSQAQPTGEEEWGGQGLVWRRLNLDTFLWTLANITFYRHDRLELLTQTRKPTHSFHILKCTRCPPRCLGGMVIIITDLLWHLLCKLSCVVTNTRVRCSHSTDAEFITMPFVCAAAPPTKYNRNGLTSEPYKPLRIGFIRQRKQG